MLISLLLAATVLTPSAIPEDRTSQNRTSQDRTSQNSLPFTITIPAIPAFGTATLSLPRSRALIPLTATLALDPDAEMAREEQDLVHAINTERTARSLPPLSADPLLCETARAHSREMCDLNYFAHRSPTAGDETPGDRYLEELHTAGVKRPDTALIGENIFYASMTSDVYGAGYAHKSLMASPTHRLNILEPRFTKVGIGLYRDPRGRFWVTEMFLRDS